MHGEAQPYRMPIRPCFGWGLPSHAVTNMLVRSYRTFSAFLLTRMRQWEFKFLQHFPSGFPARPLAGILPQEARTFLMGLRAPRDHPARIATAIVSLARKMRAKNFARIVFTHASRVSGRVLSTGGHIK